MLFSTKCLPALLYVAVYVVPDAGIHFKEDNNYE